MTTNNIKQIYSKEGWDAALEAYRTAIEEHKGQEDSLNELAFLAADYAHGKALELLFEAEVSPQITDKYAYNLLHYVARQQESRHCPKPKGAVAQTTALLLDNKVSALRKDQNENMTCYHYAARNGLAEMIETMAERGVKLNMTDKDGNTGIHIACDYVKHVIREIDFNKRNLENATKKYEATVAQMKEQNESDEEIAEYITKWNMSPKKYQMAYDATIQLIEDYFRVVKAFAEGGVDIDEKNGYGTAALDIAVSGDAKKIAAYLSGTLGDAADSNAIAAGGMTLHQAVEKGDMAAIKAIMATGVDLNSLKDDKPHNMGGCTPLALACAYLHVDAVEALLAGGADPSFKDSNGCAAVNYIGSMASVIETTFTEKCIPRTIKNLVSAGMNINMPVNDDSDTLLISACKKRGSYAYKRYSVKAEIIDQALKLNPDINLANRFGETALMYACAWDFEMMENVQLTLLEQGADVAAADKNGDTALHYAARNDDKNAAKTLCNMLLEFGADPNAVNNDQKTALDIATEQDNEPLVKMLLVYG